MFEIMNAGNVPAGQLYSVVSSVAAAGGPAITGIWVQYDQNYIEVSREDGTKTIMEGVFA